MTAPKVLANTSLFDEVQLDNSYDATINSNAAGDDASELVFRWKLFSYYQGGWLRKSKAINGLLFRLREAFPYDVSPISETSSIDAELSPGRAA